MDQPEMVVLDADTARRVADNMDQFAVYWEAVAAHCLTEKGRVGMLDHARAMRIYARGLLKHARRD